jgi:ADP-ribose pyrophosphatase
VTRPWKKISESLVLRNPWWKYQRDEFELPSGKRGEYHYVHTNGSSMVVPIMPDGSVLTVRQHRYLAAKDSIEFPCGSVKDGSTYDETAHHELTEETGYSAGMLSRVGEFNPYNGVTDEMCHVYIARELHHVGGSPDDTEEFDLVVLSADEIDSNIRSGVIWDGMTMAAWQLAKPRLYR